MPSNLFNTSALFWLCAGVLIGVAATFSLGNLWRHVSQRLGPVRGVAIATASTAAVVTIAAFLYLRLGQPESIATTTPPHASARSNAQSANSTANSMESVTEQLASRLARDGGG
ncbi:MAG TPA: hypothetical protein VET48_01860, partial [Steroidobacteraceae bacterium]|nr:hypothetical protein [Steroidobacteraceae bacterium]